MRVYLAAPLFRQAEREFNQQLADQLEAAGYSVFLPQRDGPEDDISPGYAARIFQADREGVAAADAMVAVCDGIPMDDGTAWEVGYAYGRGIPIIGLRTDYRRSGAEVWFNIMIQQSLTHLVESIEAVVPALNQLPRR